MSDLITTAELNRLAQEIERKKQELWLKEEQSRDSEKKQLHDAFFERQIHPEVKARVSAAVRRAVEGGVSEIMVVSFPCEWTNDRGRRVNNFEADWPESLEGFAKRAFEFYDKELRPAGYKIKAKVLSFTGDGIPKEIGVYLSW